MKRIYAGLFSYLERKLTRAQYITVAAILTGLVSGMVAVLLKTVVHYFQRTVNTATWYYLAFPTVGLVLTVLISQRFFGGAFEKGIGMVLRAIAKKSSFIPTSNTYKHFVTSSLTVGLGGSAGLEAPIVATGSSYGSLFGRILNLNYPERSLMIACGAAAGISAVFNAPVAGVIFAIEVLLTEAVVSYFIPLIISSVAGALCSKIILNEHILFNFILKQDFNYYNVPYYALLGVLAGFVSLYYARVFKKTETAIHHYPLNPYLKAISGGILLAGIFYFLPPLFGEGYKSVTLLATSETGSLTSGNLLRVSNDNNISLLVIVALLLLLKPLAAAITIGAGGNGGNFAPSLFVGSSLGFFTSRLLNSTGWLKLPEGNFTLAGMAGALSGIMYCPLTAIFLIAEITNGYALFIPLMIVSSLSFFIVKHFEPYSMELKKLAMEGEVFTHKKEENILATINLESILSAHYETIPAQALLGQLVELIKKSDKNIFAVVDEKGKFTGIIELNDIKKILFEINKHKQLPIKQFTKKPREIIYLGEPMKKVMEKFDAAQSWYLPVLDHDRKYIGFVSKTRLFEKYREIIAERTGLYENE